MQKVLLYKICVNIIDKRKCSLLVNVAETTLNVKEI